MEWEGDCSRDGADEYSSCSNTDHDRVNLGVRGIYQVLVHTHPLPVYDGCCIQEVVSLQLVDSVYLSHATIILVEINAHLGRSFVPQGSCDLADLGQFYSFQYDVLDGINIKL